MNSTIIASELLTREAVKLSPERAFVWASGIHSPIYCDNRSLLSHPESRKKITDIFVQTIKSQFNDVEVVAGVATGAIAWGLLVAEALDLPFIYIRSANKKHGLTNRIEGMLPKGKKVLVVEDLISTGGSSLSAVEALRDVDADVLGMVAIFSYLLPKADENFKNAKCELHCLSNFNVLLEEAVRSNYVSQQEADNISEWRKSL